MKYCSSLFLILICLMEVKAQENKAISSELKPIQLNTKLKPAIFERDTTASSNFFNVKNAYGWQSIEMTKPVNLNMNFYFKAYPVKYVNGRYLMTPEGPYYPPYPLNDQSIIIPQKRKVD